MVTRPIPNSSASSSHTGKSIKTTRNIATVTAVLLHVPTSVTSFRQGFSGVLCENVTFYIEKPSRDICVISDYTNFIPGILAHTIPKEAIKVHQAKFTRYTIS